MTGSFETASGARLDPYNIRPHDVRAVDLAHHLSMINRFNGATPVPYSVAQHCIKCATAAREAGWGPEVQLWCLLHDAPEAYLGDMVRPLKSRVWADMADGTDMVRDNRVLVTWRDVEARVMKAICAAVGIPGPGTGKLEGWHIRETVSKTIDEWMLYYEALAFGFRFDPPGDRPQWLDDVDIGFRILPWGWEAARSTWLNVFGAAVEAVRETQTNTG